MDYEKIKEIESKVWDHLQQRGVALNVYTVLTSLDQLGYVLQEPHGDPTIIAADDLDSDPKCLCPCDGIYAGCPVHGYQSI